MKIFIDAGHNYSGSDTGAMGNGLKEQEITFPIALKLKKLLINAGHDVKMSRNKVTDNVGKTLSESINKRAEMSNSWGAEFFISIHANSGGGKGVETLIYAKGNKAEETAKRIGKSVAKKLDLANRGVKVRPDLGVLRLTNAPAVLVETAFIDNVADAQKLAYKQGDFAEAIFEGITGKKPKSNDLTEIADIINELYKREIITDKALWSEKLKEDKNAYWLAQKTVKYLITHGVE